MKAQKPKRLFAVFPELALQYFQHEYSQGDELAAWEAIKLCREANHPMPEWLGDFLAARADRALSGDPKPLGKHSDPELLRRDRRNQKMVLAAITACIGFGYRGAARDKKAVELLAAEGLAYKQSSIKQARNQIPEYVIPGLSHYAVFTRRLRQLTQGDDYDPDEPLPDVSILERAKKE